MRTAALALVSLAAMLITGCSTHARPGADELRDSMTDSGSGRNVLRWGGDGTSSTTSAQPFGALVEPTSIDTMSTGPAGVFTIGTPGVLAVSPGDTTANVITTEFADPILLPDGTPIVVPSRVHVEGWSSTKSDVIEATTPQVELWAAFAEAASDDQREVAIEELEAQGAIGSEFAGALREALGLIAGP